MSALITDVKATKFYGVRVDSEIAAVYTKEANKRLICRTEIAGDGLPISYYVVVMFEGDHCCYDQGVNTLKEAVALYNDLE